MQTSHFPIQKTPTILWLSLNVIHPLSSHSSLVCHKKVMSPFFSGKVVIRSFFPMLCRLLGLCLHANNHQVRDPKQSRHTMGCGASTAAATSGTRHSTTDPYVVKVDEIWVEVKKTLEEQMGKTKAKRNLVIKRTGWKTVRVFVSSTFKDFHQEREVLVKKVIIHSFNTTFHMQWLS